MQLRINASALYINLLFLLALISSFDIFLNFRIFGYSFRIFYIIEFFVLLLIIRNILQGYQRKVLFIGYPFILIWALFIILFIPNTTLLYRNVGYAVWFFLSVCIVFIFSALSTRLDPNKFYKLFKLYINSFTLIAIFGLIQFFAGLMGINLFITQWWIYGVLPRVNGFSYEPSYYGTYLIIGWSILAYLYIKDRKISQKCKYHLLIITIAIILSTSRMTIFTMFIAFFLLILFSILQYVPKLKVKKRNLKLLSIYSLSLMFIGMLIYRHLNEVKFIFSGVGLSETPSHSISERMEAMKYTFQAFLNSPIIGYSLGGIPSAIAKLKGIIIHNQIEAKQFEGINIFAEVLAASGIIGFMFFILYLINLYYKALKIIKKLKERGSNFYLIISSLSFALSIELFMLSMNQNILRPYLWVLIGMFSSSILMGKRIAYENNH